MRKANNTKNTPVLQQARIGGFTDNIMKYTPRNGETFQQLHERINTFFESLCCDVQAHCSSGKLSSRSIDVIMTSVDIAEVKEASVLNSEKEVDEAKDMHKPLQV